MSRLADAGAPVAATILAAARWALQDSDNIYTDLSHGYYEPEPELGWRYVEEGPLWLGLDVVAGLLVSAIILYALGAWVDRRPDAERLREGIVGRVVWALGLATIALPVAAFVTGNRPAGAVDALPEQVVQAPDDGIAAHLDGMPAGTYAVAPDHPRNVIVATVSAGGEQFEARFGGLRGSWKGDPGDMHQPMEARLVADPTTVDTGVDARSTHAQEYLQVAEHEALVLHLDAITGTEADDDGAVRLAATGRLEFMGDDLPVALTGTVRPLDAKTRTRLQLTEAYAMRVEAGFSLRIADTKLQANASDFSAESIPIRVELILVHQ